MRGLIQVAGTIALIVAGLYFALAVLDVSLDIASEIWWWMRYRLLPGLMWAFGLGLGIWVLWGLFSRNGRVG